MQLSFIPYLFLSFSPSFSCYFSFSRCLSLLVFFLLFISDCSISLTLSFRLSAQLPLFPTLSPTSPPPPPSPCLYLFLLFKCFFIQCFSIHKEQDKNDLLLFIYLLNENNAISLCFSRTRAISQ